MGPNAFEKRIDIDPEPERRRRRLVVRADQASPPAAPPKPSPAAFFERLERLCDEFDELLNLEPNASDDERLAESAMHALVSLDGMITETRSQGRGTMVRVTLAYTPAKIIAFTAALETPTDLPEGTATYPSEPRRKAVAS